MSFSIISNTSQTEITEIGSYPYGSIMFSANTGSFPLLSGDTISGSNDQITSNYFSYFGSTIGLIYLDLVWGSAQIEYYVNSILYSVTDCGSGINVFRTPIVDNEDVLSFVVNDLTAPAPPPSNTETPTNTPTPSTTPIPSSTPRPECSYNEFIITWDDTNPEPTILLGNYARQTSYTGGTFSGGYFDYDVLTFVPGAAPNGNTYYVYLIQLMEDNVAY